MTTFTIEYTQLVVVTLDETKFTEEFMREYRESFYEFRSIEDHARHIAQLDARGMFDREFEEGYGNPDDMGIKSKCSHVNTEVLGTMKTD